MLGVALLHMLPHALAELESAASADLVERGGAAAELEGHHDHDEADHGAHGHGHGHGGYGPVRTAMLSLLAGLLAMFLVERFFTFHQHEAPGGEKHRHEGHDDRCAAGAPAVRGTRLTWTGAAVGLTLHTLVEGVALAASVESDSVRGVAHAAGFSTFLVIFLHKPFDSLSIGTLMAAGRHRVATRHLVNVLFSLSIPAAVVLFYLGLLGPADDSRALVGVALAFSAGTFLCIALSDLLPELHFHHHDRVKLSAALLLGLLAAWASGAAGG
jgi:zinc and cadmium transporter